MNRVATTVVLAALLAVAGLRPAHAQIYVDKDAGGNNDGSSWTNAYTDLQTAIGNATSSDEIWIAEGVYKPDNEGDSFTITGNKDGLEVYGGFDGTESTRSDRAPKENRTILSGDLNGDDNDPDGDGIIEDASDLTGGENADHVLVLDGGDGLGSDVGDNVTSSTVLDGLVITAGQADGSSFPDDSGGGLFCDGARGGNECSPTLENVVFAGNKASGDGGAIINEGFEGTSSPSITNATFTGNEATGDLRGGGAINNSALRGTSSPSITNATFTSNEASLYGGAIYNYGDSGTSSPSITNATFTGNTASQDGGAIYNDGSSGGTSSPQVANTILWGNSASDSGGEIYNNSASATLTYTIIEGGVNGSGVGGDDNDDDGDNLDQDPLFVDVATPAGPDGTFATDDDGLNVVAGSPALDAGDNGEIPSGVDEDITGADRTQDRDDNGTARVNIGAYEVEELARTIHVDVDADGAGDGTSWADAYTDLQAAIDADVTTANDEIWMAEGVYTPDSEGDSFTITGQKDGIEVYGGFDGTESTRDERDADANVTVLSGDIDGNDTTDDDGVTPTADDINGDDNAHHVLVLDGGDRIDPDVGDNVMSNTVLDGLVITAGQADGSPPNDLGGGLYCDGFGSGNECSPTLANALFAGNEATNFGGAIFNDGQDGTSSPQVTGATFTGNAASNDGGAIFNFGDGGTSSPSVTNATFTGNTASRGGAIFNFGEFGTSSPSITGATFTGNTASGDGGAIYNDAGSPQVANTILWGNAADDGDEIYNESGASATLTHTIIEGGVNGSGVGGPGSNTDDGGNLDQDPQFADASTPAGPDGMLATADDGLNVTPGSPAIDAGDNGEIPSGVDEDITGADRTQDQNGSGTATVNLGAYEQIPPGPPVASGTAAQNVTGTSAEVTGTASAAGLETDVQVRYFPTADPSDVTTATAPSSPIAEGNFADQSVTVDLSGLQPGTEYEARILASNQEGSTQDRVVFTTQSGYTRSITGTDGTGNDAGWRMLALPAADKDRSALEGDLTFSTNSGSILYRWASGSWAAQEKSDDALPRGRGFMLYFFDDVIDPIDAEGLPLAVGTGSEDQSTDKTVSGLGQSETFHLLGNPFDVAFDLSELNLSGQGFQQTVQIWDPSSQSYTQVTQSGDQSDVIGAWQGFFVERDPNASTEGTSLTFSTAGKQSGPGTIIGSQSATLADTKRSEEKRLRLGLRLAVLDTTSGDTAPPSPKADAAAPTRSVPDSLTAEAAASQSSDGAQAAEAGADTVGTGRLGLLLSSEATGGWDAYEASQLGPPGGGQATVALSSPLEQGPEESVVQRALASEPYPTGSSGESAAVTVPVSLRANAAGRQATLRLPDAQREQVPSGWALRLTDTRAGEQADLLTEAYRFTLDETGEAGGTAPPESRFRLAVGPRGALPTPDGLALEAPYPNPTTRSVTVEYAVPQDKADGAQLQLYDVLGRRVRTVSVKPGPHAQRLDVSGLASGVYILRLTAEGAQQTRKLTVVR